MTRSIFFAAIPALFMALLFGVACDGGDDNDNNSSGGADAITNAQDESDAPGAGLPGSSDEQATVAGQQPVSVADIAATAGASVVRVGVNCQQDTPSLCQGTGSGWLYDDDGHFVTNNHVVTLDGQFESPVNVLLTTLDGRVLEASVVGGDPNTDLAVLEADHEDMEPLELASAEDVRIGEPVVAIGYALDLGISPSVTTGVVSAKERQILDPRTQIYGLLQTDAAINPGNSGGPLLDHAGRVLGVNTATIQGAQGIGFAISANMVSAVADEILEKGSVDRGFLGIGFQEITPGQAEQLDLPVDAGVRIDQVLPGSPADEAGLREGDVLVRIEDTDIVHTSDLTLALLEQAPGAEVEVEYFRGDDQRTADVRLGEPPTNP